MILAAVHKTMEKLWPMRRQKSKSGIVNNLSNSVHNAVQMFYNREVDT
jgi:hypothetical protein